MTIEIIFVLAALFLLGAPLAIKGNAKAQEPLPPPGTPINQEEEEEARWDVAILVAIVVVMFVIVIVAKG